MHHLVRRPNKEREEYGEFDLTTGGEEDRPIQTPFEERARPFAGEAEGYVLTAPQTARVEYSLESETQIDSGTGPADTEPERGTGGSRRSSRQKLTEDDLEDGVIRLVESPETRRQFLVFNTPEETYLLDLGFDTVEIGDS